MVACTLCPHLCRIRPAEVGICKVRANVNGRPALPHYAKVSGLNVDPVEKKPLYHLQPGSRLLSVGFLGCNFRCPFCQNYAISQSTLAQTRTLHPRDLSDLATQSGAQGVAYTYNEPTIHWEYLMEAADLVRAAGLGNVLVTNGHVNARPAKELLERIDGANVDLKSFSSSFYERELGGSLDAVREFITIAAELTHLEVTTLLIPGRNDSDEEVSSIASFIASIDPSVPLHLSAYYPTYRYEIEATSMQTVHRARDLALRHLRYVYTGNIAGEGSTRCPACDAVLVGRRGYSIDLSGLRGHACASCGTPAPFRWFDAADAGARDASGADHDDASSADDASSES